MNTHLVLLLAFTLPRGLLLLFLLLLLLFIVLTLTRFLFLLVERRERSVSELQKAEVALYSRWYTYLFLLFLKRDIGREGGDISYGWVAKDGGGDQNHRYVYDTGQHTFLVVFFFLFLNSLSSKVEVLMPLILSVICLWRRLPSTGGSSPRKIRLGVPTSYDDGWVEAGTWWRWWMDRRPIIRPSVIERRDKVTAIDDSFMISDVDMGWYQRWWRWGGEVWLLALAALSLEELYLIGLCGEIFMADWMCVCVCMHLYAVLLNSAQ